MGMIPNFRSTEKTDGYSLKEAKVNVERRRMTMKILVSALFAAAVIIPAALADEQEDAYAAVERWSAAFNSGDVEQIVRMYTDDALVLGTLSPGMISKPDDLRAYFKAAVALAELSGISTDKRILGYQPYWAALGHEPSRQQH